MRLRTAAAYVGIVGVLLVAGCSPGVPEDEEQAPAGTSVDRTLSPEDEADLDAWLAERAALFSVADPPQVERIRLVSMADTAPTQIDCLTAAGFPAALSEDGQGWEVEIPPGQNESYGLVAYTCAAEYPTDPAQDDSRITDAQKKVAYAYLTDTLVTCLADHGFDVTDIPSEETFLGSWDTRRWNPYDQLQGVPATVQETCPANTPPDLLWGS